MKRDRVRGHLDLMLLSVLAEAPRHGYAAIAAMKERSHEVFDLPEGTVYPALHKLEGSGLVSSTWDRVEGRRRRVYRLTADGHAALAAERGEWRAFVVGVESIIGLAT